MIVIYEEIVIEISSHLFGRDHGCIDVEVLPFRERRENGGQHIFLDALCQIQLGADPLLLLNGLGEILFVGVEILFHVRQGEIKILYFISRIDPQPFEMVL